MEAGVELSLRWIESSSLECAANEGFAAAWAALAAAAAVVCPGGFGDRGIWGKALSAQHCREQKKPYLGICLGMQTAVIEFARNVLGLHAADSEEFNPQSPHPVVVAMPEHNPGHKGGSMRLGRRTTCIRSPESLAAALYDKKSEVSERHRHRFEVNPVYVHRMERAGLRFVGRDPSGNRMEIAELQNHPFFICSQFHPEFTSKPLKPNPLFLGLVLAAAGLLQQRLQQNGGVLRPGHIYTQQLLLQQQQQQQHETDKKEHTTDAH